jgi:hypothetical protein
LGDLGIDGRKILKLNKADVDLVLMAHYRV